MRSETLNSLNFFNANTVAIEKQLRKVETSGIGERCNTVGKITCVIIPAMAGIAIPTVIKKDCLFNNSLFLILNVCTNNNTTAEITRAAIQYIWIISTIF